MAACNINGDFALRGRDVYFTAGPDVVSYRLPLKVLPSKLT
jgi:hypothetical protein